MSDRLRSVVRTVVVTPTRKTGWRQIGRATILAAAILLVLPASGQSRLPPEDDGSSYTWPGATAVTVDVQPWGGGYVRSTPYLIDCPLACIRPFQRGREMTLTAYPTPGFTFESVDRRLRGPAESVHVEHVQRPC